jgi:hypothetical protein
VGGYHQPYQGFLRHFSHYSETVLQHVTNAWAPADREKHFDRFTRMDWYRVTYTANKTINFSLPTCGNKHYPGNTKSNYGYTDNAEYNSACKDWGNFPDYTNRTERISCTAWGCTDNGWQEYFLSSIPRGSGTTTLRTAKGKAFTVKKNWWPYILDLREATTIVNSTK